MSDEEMQKLWQNQHPPGTGVRDMAALLAATREGHRQFRRTIFWRDFREVLVGLVVLPFWCLGGARSHAGWAWWLMIPAVLFVVGFLLLDRWRHRSHRAHPDDSMLVSLTKAVREMEHQIHLLRHVLWWYVGPISAVLIAIDLERWMRGRFDARQLITHLLLDVAVAYIVWRLNQKAVQKTLEPRRAELQQLLDDATA